jgi:hypothetical protein
LKALVLPQRIFKSALWLHVRAGVHTFSSVCRTKPKRSRPAAGSKSASSARGIAASQTLLRVASSRMMRTQPGAQGAARPSPAVKASARQAIKRGAVIIVHSSKIFVGRRSRA